MKMLSSMGALLIVALFACSCGKDKATSSPTAYAVTLRYQSYYLYQCIRLNVGSISIDRCNLGERGASQNGGNYEWRLFGIDNSEEPERYILLQSGTVILDRNKTCVVNYASVTWQ
jgi:hypothetical protein